MKVVVAIPCFNTESSIADVVCRSKKYADQVIIINDGSHDNTAEVASQAGASVINHETNRGYGGAIKSCFEAAIQNDADVLVILDGDGQHNPDEIPMVLDPILKGEADLVIGSRFINNKHTIPSYRKFGISVITFFWNVGSKVKVSDTQSGFRAYKKEVFQNLSSTEEGMSISIEIIEEARRKGATIKEGPISCAYVSSTPNFRAVKHGIGVALSVIKIRLKSSRLSQLVRETKSVAQP